MVAWAALTASAWSWWLQPANSASATTLLISSALLSVEMLLLPLWFFFWIWRMKRPNPALGVPELRTAIVVTKAPSEPWELVRATLEAMLAQDFPYPYDTWLADESPAARHLRVVLRARRADLHPRGRGRLPPAELATPHAVQGGKPRVLL